MSAIIFLLISLIVFFQDQSVAKFVVAPSALGRDLERCLDLCETYSCQNDRNIKEGCNQMFSCAHGCKLRQLGLVHGNCRDQCRRNGQSGCGPNVSGWKFDLCRECNRGGCTPRPQVWECEQGCNFYKDTGNSGTEPSIEINPLGSNDECQFKTCGELCQTGVCDGHGFCVNPVGDLCAPDECQFKTCGELCHTGICDGHGFCVNPEENPCVQHGCGGLGKSCGDPCLAGDIVGSCDINGDCDFDINRAINSCDKQEAPKQEGESCGPCLCPPTYSAGDCAEGLTCERDERLPDAPGICTRPEAPKQEGESCGHCLCPPTYSAGDCAEGLNCERDERLPDAPGICTRPQAPKQEGESCGHCFCPPTYSAGDCAEGLTCERNERLPDAPGICTRPEIPKQEGESCGPCFCPPTYSAGDCAEGLTCERDERLPDAAGICTRPENPCSSGRPLTDPSGVELFCGLGPNRVECPTGSSCLVHPTDRYALCCPEGPPSNCPRDFIEDIGDVVGGGIRGGFAVKSIAECGQACKQESTCNSFNYSPTKYWCVIYQETHPTAPKYQDFGFCSKKQVGSCSRDELAFCPCTKEIDSVCAGGILYDNPCLYECAKKKAECATGQRFPNVGHIRECIGDCSRDEIDNICSCTREYVPVCAGGIRYNNLCLYECAKKEAECATHQRFPNVLPPYSNGQCFSPDSNGRPSEIKCRDDEEHLDGDTLCCRKKNDHSIVYCK